MKRAVCLISACAMLISIFTSAVWAYWYFKPGYDDYAPSGMPDFDQNHPGWMSFCGPTAAAKSVGKLDHARTEGTLLNMRISPQCVEGSEDLHKLAALIRGYFDQGGHHVQFNIVDANILREAQKHPEKHKDLIVRVAGYSDYFVDLSLELQDEIIHRTEHLSF